MANPTCNVCGGPVVHGNLYCSLACANVKEAQNNSAASALVDAGFVQDAEMPNVYRRDGISITLEHIDHVGLDKALSEHANVAAIRAHALGVRTSEPETASTESATH